MADCMASTLVMMLTSFLLGPDNIWTTSTSTSGVGERLLHRLRIMGNNLQQRTRGTIWQESALLPIAYD